MAVLHAPALASAAPRLPAVPAQRRPAGAAGGRARPQQPAGPDDSAKRRQARRDRYRLRESLWRLSSLPSVKGCGRTVRRDVGAAQVMLGANGIAGFTGLNLCSSVSACSCCSGRIRQTRAAQIEAAGVAHCRAGGSLAFATYTMPHQAAHLLTDLLEAIKAAWKALREDKAFRQFRKAFGAAYVRAIEITFTAGEIGGNGWHPHLHVLWFFDIPPSADELQTFFHITTSAWAGRIMTSGFGRPDQFDLQEVNGRADAQGLIRYLTKVQDNLDRGSWGPGQEMTRGDLKHGRKRSRTPFELLASAAGLVDGTAHPADLQRWHEYEKATKGLRVIEAARGLFKRLGVADVVDELAPEAGPDPQLIATIPFDAWRHLARARKLAALLELVEAGGDQGDVDALLEMCKPP